MKRFAALIPYISVLIGLYLIENGWAAILLYHAGMVLVLALDTPPGLARSIRSGWNAKAAVIGGVMCASGGVVLYILWPTVRPAGADLAPELARLGLEGAAWWLFVAYFATIHPVLEEAFWRCYMAGKRPRLHRTDAAFAGYHVLVLYLFVRPLWLPVVFVVLALAAWAWRLAAARWQGLAVPVITHAVADLSIMLAVTAILAAERTLL